jgi:hypothetical protein
MAAGTQREHGVFQKNIIKNFFRSGKTSFFIRGVRYLDAAFMTKILPFIYRNTACGVRTFPAARGHNLLLNGLL